MDASQLPIIAAALIAPLYLALCLASRPVALAVFCGLLPAYLVRLSFHLPFAGGFDLPTTLLEIMFIELFVAWLLTDGTRSGAWSSLAEFAEPIALLLIGATIGLSIAPDIRSALGIWRAYYIEPVLFFVLFTDIITRTARARNILMALAGALIGLGITAVFQKYTGYGIPNPVWQAEATRRITSVYGFPNAVALFSAPLAVLMIAWAAELWRTKLRSLAAIPALAAAAAVGSMVFAVSEGGLIAFAAGLLTLGLLEKRLRPWALGAIIAGCVAVIAYRPLTDYASLIVSLRDDSGAVRRIVWSETGAMLAEHPVFGAGLSGYPDRLRPYHLAHHIEIFQYPHNLVLNFWSEIGLIGLIGFLWAVVRFFGIAMRKRVRKTSHWVAIGAAAAMVTLLVHGLVDVPYMKNDLAFMFWIIVGLVEATRRLANARTKEEEKPPTPWNPWLT